MVESKSVTSFSHAVFRTCEYFPEEDSYLVIVNPSDTPLEGAKTPHKYDPAQSPRVFLYGDGEDARIQLRVPTSVFRQAIAGLRQTDQDSLRGLNIIFDSAKDQSPLDKGSDILLVDTLEFLSPPEATN